MEISFQKSKELKGAQYGDQQYKDIFLDFTINPCVSINESTVICRNKTPLADVSKERGSYSRIFPISRVISSRPNIIEIVHKIVK